MELTEWINRELPEVVNRIEECLNETYAVYVKIITGQKYVKIGKRHGEEFKA